jgi:hypothetical protein
MSRRRARREDPAAGGEAPRGEPAPATRGLARDLAILVAVFAAVVGIAELAGAANLGVALGVGQVAFAVALVVLLTRR